ncbi:class D sortase [Novosphingobium resinovorum]|uniref:class D sortase n=1 Tax=Novosphingobium resinovorum TaxID=158500 RepID=UPI002ED09D0B|nr:class D sortase [Novosphingobium resinovorum]
MNRALRRLAGGMSLVACLAGGAQFASGLAVPVKAGIAQHRLERSFEARLAAGQKVAPGARPGARLATAALSLPDEGAIARIAVPRLGVRQIVLAGNGTHEQLAEGPTLIRRTTGPAPVTILAAHRDTHFLFIRDLRLGDTLTMQFVDGATERYRVTRFETVRWDRFAYPVDPARALLALATCYPFGGTEYGGPWRRVVWAERIGPDSVASPRPEKSAESRHF